MPSQKRKANGHECECFEAHETKDDCEKQVYVDEREAFAAKHRAITAQVILYSETIEVFAGTADKQTFIVHKDLLALHSTYFLNLFSDKGPGVDKKVSVSAKPSLFADFVSWIYFGEFLKVKNDALEGNAAVDDLWQLGRFFKAPAFQNFCMDDCRAYCKASEIDPQQPWPFVQGIKQMYSITRKGSQLRKLAVDSLSYKNPLHENKKGSAAWKEWKALLTGQNSQESWMNDLREDFALEAGTDWKKIPPWDDRRRDDYMEEEIPLEERWDAQILATRPRADIQRAALAKKNVRSIIEWAHLQRGEVPEEE